MSLKPQNLIQAAQADLKRLARNKDRYDGDPVERFAFHRNHVRRAKSAGHLIVMALMDPAIARDSAKFNTRLIYGDAGLLAQAARMARQHENPDAAFTPPSATGKHEDAQRRKVQGEAQQPSGANGQHPIQAHSEGELKA
jgi:hypothetical protein